MVAVRLNYSTKVRLLIYGPRFHIADITYFWVLLHLYHSGWLPMR